MTSISNGVCLCQGCHTRVHEGGYSIQHVYGNAQRLDAQFEQQQRTDDLTLFTVEKALRNDRVSFNQVRNLMPTRYRFRIVDANGNDIRNGSTVKVSSANACKGETHSFSTPVDSSSAHSTRVEYGNPISGGCGDRDDREDGATSHVAEQSALYRFDTGRYPVAL